MRTTCTKSKVLRWSCTTTALLAALTIGPAQGVAQGVGGHFGVVVPTVSRAQGVTTSVTDNLSLAFPMGITVKRAGALAFDFELVAGVDTGPMDVSLTVHPGLIYAINGRHSAGIRAAFDVEGESVGFTPLIVRSFPMSSGVALFAELDVPVRWIESPVGNSFTSIGLGLHFGIGF